HMRAPIYEGGVHPPDAYSRFGTLAKFLREDGNQVSVVTFNYDLGVDMGLWLNGVEIDYALRGSYGPSGAVELFKLHGSVNWGVCADKNCYAHSVTTSTPAIYPHEIRDIVADLEKTWRHRPRPKGFVSLQAGPGLASMKCTRCGQDCRST